MWLKEDGRKDIELMNDEIITQILSRVEGYIKQEENVENSELLQKFIASKEWRDVVKRRYIIMRAQSLKCLPCWISMCIKYGLMI